MGTEDWGMGNWEWGLGNGEWGMGNGEWGLGIGDWEIELSLISLKQIKSEYISFFIASCFAISDFLFGIPHCC